MSTKIFNAYRINKEVDILKILKNIREKFTEEVSKNGDYLKIIHTTIMYNLAKKIKNDPNNKFYKSIVDDNKKGKFDILTCMDILYMNQYSYDKINYSTKFECSIFYDEDYWYVKFYPNENIQYNFLKKIEEFGFEDYHYQNQTDIPENISDEEYEKRGEKWNNLLNDDYDFTDGFNYEIFGPDFFKKLLTKKYYTGKDIYEHLDYKFDRIYFKD